MTALHLVYRQPRYLLAALLLFPIMAIFYAWAGQVLDFGSRGPSLLIEPDVIAAIVVLAALFAVSLPLQIFAFRLAVAGARQAGGTVLGALVGTVSMSCCAPVLLPALLSLLGFSGTAILSVNVTVHRYFVPLAMVAIALLGYSLLATAASLGRTCTVDTTIAQPNHFTTDKQGR